jgi:hypothetical protein
MKRPPSQSEHLIRYDDLMLCSETLAALEHGRPGAIYNIVDDEPASMGTS